jgi:inosine/xanthosine triphosphatase
MLISIGSKNPAKIAAVEQAFRGYAFEMISVDTESGVRAQPLTDEETIKGAINRAVSALDGSGADIGIGLEGGVQETEHGLFLCDWGALFERGNEPIIAGGARITLPEEIASRLLAGEELGPVMDEYAQKQNVRKKEGAIGIFTNGKIDRVDMFLHVVKLLLGQFEFNKQTNKWNLGD